jgi:hypothetical protein
MAGKAPRYTRHAAEKLLERHITDRTVRNAVGRGARLQDKGSGATLCIYKEKRGKFYTVVIEEKDGQVEIITCYESSMWQAEYFRKVRKNEHGKVL